jgi:hypothetical protein
MCGDGGNCSGRKARFSVCCILPLSPAGWQCTRASPLSVSIAEEEMKLSVMDEGSTVQQRRC